MTLYIIMPSDKMVVWAGLQRLWLGCLLRIITRGVASERNPVLFLVDECAHIGKMQALEDAVTLMRGPGAAYDAASELFTASELDGLLWQAIAINAWNRQAVATHSRPQPAVA